MQRQFYTHRRPENILWFQRLRQRMGFAKRRAEEVWVGGSGARASNGPGAYSFQSRSGVSCRATGHSLHPTEASGDMDYTFSVRMLCSLALFSGLSKDSSVPGGSLAKASSVGAKTVNGPGPFSVCTSPAALTAATRVLKFPSDNSLNDVGCGGSRRGNGHRQGACQQNGQVVCHFFSPS